MKKLVFWRNKKVLVTGHTGFVGTWLCAVLMYFGADVYGVALRSDDGSLNQEIQKHLGVKETILDLRNGMGVAKIVSEIKPEIIIHLAAYGFIKECYEDPQKAYSTNVMGTLNLLEAIRNSESVRSILVVSSDKVYQNKVEDNNHFFEETEPLGGEDPYSCSKTCEDLITQSYFKSYLRKLGVDVNIVRPGNILGGGDHIKSRLLPGLLDGFQSGSVVEIRHPNAVRPWQHILDAIDAYLVVIQHTYQHPKDHVGIYNVGPAQKGQMSVGKIAVYISKKFEDVKIQLGEEMAIDEANYLGVDSSKIMKETEWSPKKNMKEVLDDVYDFWKRGQTEDKYTLCMEQIECYYERAAMDGKIINSSSCMIKY